MNADKRHRRAKLKARDGRIHRNAGCMKNIAGSLLGTREERKLERMFRAVFN